MRVRLNLATKAQENHRRFMLAAGFVGVIGLILFVALGWHVYAVRKLDARLRAESVATSNRIAELQAQRVDLERFFAQPENARLHDRAAFLNSLIDGRSFNWTQMFMDLERILPGGVRLISIEPKQVKGHVEVRLTVGAASDEAKLKFLRALEESHQFSGIEMDSEHTPTNTRGGVMDQKVVGLTAIYSRS
jgi:type IV pilus assembly protein PilN